MPELPEVETIRRGIAQRALGSRVVEVLSSGGRLFRNNPAGAEDVRQLVLQGSFASVERRGKFMWMTVDSSNRAAESAPAALVVHLGMSGQVRVSTPENRDSALARHEHLRLTLEDGSAISFVDQRTFGHLTVSDLVEHMGRPVPRLMGHIAPDPLEESFDPEWVLKKGGASRRRIKTLLLDQGLVSGIGNIYADEALYRAGLSGLIPGSELPQGNWLQLLEASTAVMKEALEVGGTSFDSLYVDVTGNPGYFTRALAVYGRDGDACRGCGTPVERLVVDGRSHFYCPRYCQAQGGESPRSRVYPVT